MKKLLTLALALGLAVALLAGCNNIQPLPAGMDEDTIVAEAKLAVDALNSRDYAALIGYFADFDMTEEDWAEIIGPVLDEMGAFEDYGSAVTTGHTEEDSDGNVVPYGIVFLTCNYENGEKVYQVTFDTDSERVGFYIL